MLNKILHVFAKYLPNKVRREILPNVLGRFIARVMVAGREIKYGTVTIVGFLSSTVGIGGGARLSYYALRDLGYDVNYVDAGKIFYWHNNISLDFGAIARHSEGGVIIFHLNPPELSIILPLLGRRYVKHKKIVGYWAWELETVPQKWMSGFHLVDEVWVPSSFVASALVKLTNIPVRIVRHPVRKPVLSLLVRRDFGLQETDFVVLTMFDMRSSAERKNPMAAIRAFRKAFNDRDDVILIIKITNPSESRSVMDSIKREIDGAKNIRIMFDKLSQEDNASLINCSDVIVSLHRSEGFGLVLAESMLLGKPVIATAYSGNMDFMDSGCAILINYKLIAVNDPQGIYKGANIFWADPNIDEAAQWLVRLACDPELRERFGDQARKKAEEVFSLNSFKNAIQDSESLIAKVLSI